MPVVHCVLVEDLGAELHYRYAVAVAQAAPDTFGGLLGDGDAVARVHRPGGIQHQRNIDRPSVVIHLRCLKGDAGHVHTTVQRVPEDLGGDGKAVIPQRTLVLIIEGVNPFFGPHGVRVHLVARPSPVEG